MVVFGHSLGPTFVPATHLLFVVNHNMDCRSSVSRTASWRMLSFVCACAERVCLPKRTTLSDNCHLRTTDARDAQRSVASLRRIRQFIQQGHDACSLYRNGSPTLCLV